MSETTTAPAPAPKAAINWRAGASPKGAQPAGGGAVYGLGMIGALAYFLGTAESGADYALAFGKAMVWPALMVYRAFKTLGE
jgi:hypothetical protein